MKSRSMPSAWFNLMAFTGRTVRSPVMLLVWGACVLSAGCGRLSSGSGELSLERCYQACGVFTECATQAELASCAASCGRLREEAARAGATAELGELLSCIISEEKCSGVSVTRAVVEGAPQSSCAPLRARLTPKLAQCRKGSALYRNFDAGQAQIELLGCGADSCAEKTDAGAPGSPCSSPSVCSAFCCETCGAKSSQARVRACVNGACAGPGSSCEAADLLVDCRVPAAEGEKKGR